MEVPGVDGRVDAQQRHVEVGGHVDRPLARPGRTRAVDDPAVVAPRWRGASRIRRARAVTRPPMTARSSGSQAQTSAPRSWVAAISPMLASMSGWSPASGSVTNRTPLMPPAPAVPGSARRARGRARRRPRHRAPRRSQCCSSRVLAPDQQVAAPRRGCRRRARARRGRPRGRRCRRPPARRGSAPRGSGRAVGRAGRGSSGAAPRRATIGVAAAAKPAYAATGSSPRSSRPSNAVRDGSTASQVSSRSDPGRAKAAARNGPARLSNRHCSSPAPPAHQSRQTCVDAVRRIIRRPAGPIVSKWRCMATYRGESSCSGTSDSGRTSTGLRSRRMPAPRQSGAQRGEVRAHCRARVAASGAQGQLSSTWPPGSKPRYGA